METENLRTFLLVVRYHNFTRAAEQLFVAQSTVTNRILELERAAGVKLLHGSEGILSGALAKRAYCDCVGCG